MTQKQNGVLEWLQSCETPAPSEPKIKAVIVAGKSYMNSSEFNKNSMRDIILNQLQFLPLSFWIVQIILTICAVLLACILGQWRVPFYYPLTILAVMVPFLALLGAIEISKSNIYGMWEIEQSSRTTLGKNCSRSYADYWSNQPFPNNSHFNFNGIYLPEIND